MSSRTTRRRRFAVASLLPLTLIATAALSGCSSGSSQGGDKGTVGIVQFDTTTAIDSLFVSGARKALEADGWTVIGQDPKGDPGQANTICSQYVTRQVKAIVVTSFAEDQMAQCMSAASAAKVPVFFIGSPLLKGMAGAVDVTSPKPINDLFASYIKKNGITDVLTLDYTPGTPCRIRAEYRTKVLEGLDVKVSKHEVPIPGQLVDAQNATAAWLAAHPAGTGKLAIWACFTDVTAGAVAAINQEGRTDSIPIFGWDFNKTILDPLKAGKVEATLALDGEAVGKQVAGLVTDYLAGGKARGVVGATKILTSENIEQYLKDNPTALN